MKLVFRELNVAAKTEGEHTFTITEAGGSGRMMKLSGENRTYSHTAEPRFVKKANKTNELPPVSAADAGKFLGVDAEGNITLVEGGSSTTREIYVGGAADKFTTDDVNVVALNDKEFTSSDEATAYIKNFIEQNVTTVYVNLNGGPGELGDLSFLTIILLAKNLFNESRPVHLEYSREISEGQTLQGYFKAYEISDKYYVGIVLSYAS